MAVARPVDGLWHMSAPEPVGDVSTLAQRLLERAGGGPVALGLDLPLGLPRAFVTAHLPDVANFPAFLADLPNRPDFLRVANSIDEAGPRRPFFPRANPPGLNRAAHAIALGLASPADLSRPCDRATAERPAGASLFWTLGPNQSGKAAISAWRDLLLPCRKLLRLWPFEGDFLPLLTREKIVVAETYPAEAMRQLGVRLAGSKRAQSVRAAAAPSLLAACARLGVTADPAAGSAIVDGFGSDAAGEDRIDCTLGLLCVIAVLRGTRPDGIPPDTWLRRFEGWVLGQTALPAGFVPDRLDVESPIMDKSRAAPLPRCKPQPVTTLP